MSQHKCELCGTAVKVVGKTTKHYEPLAPVASVKVKEPIWPEKMVILTFLPDPILEARCNGWNDCLTACIKAWKDAQKGLV